MRGGYRNYKGARKKRNRTILSVVLVCALLVLLGYSSFQFFGWKLPENFLAFLSVFEREPAAGTDEDPLILITDSDTGGLSGGQPEPEPPEAAETPVKERLPVVRAVTLPVARLAEPDYVEAILSLMASGGINAVVIELKADTGRLSFSSQVPMAMAAGVSAEAGKGVEAAVKQLSEGGLYIIGRVSAFRDDAVSRANKIYAVKHTNGVNWLDHDYIGWLDPYVKESVDYLAALAMEMEAMGVDELILDHFAFPSRRGKLELISYGENQAESRDVPIENALATLSAGEMAVSVLLTDQAAALGSDATAGQRVEMLGKLAGRLYFSATMQNVRDGLSGTAAVSGSVPMVTVADAAQVGELAEGLGKTGYVAVLAGGNYSA